MQTLRERIANQPQLIDPETERKAKLLLYRLKNVVLDCMDCHVRQQRRVVECFSLSNEELLRSCGQETYQVILKAKQKEVDRLNARKKFKETLKEKDEEIEHLQAILAEQAGQTQPVVPENITKSGMTLFSGLASSPTISTEFSEPDLVLTRAHV